MRTIRLTLLAALAVVGATLVLADERTIQFDTSVDFRTIKTFAIAPGRVESDKPELDNRLFLLELQDIVRTTLTGKGLTAVTDAADVSVAVVVTDADFSVTRRQTGVGIVGPGMRGRGTALPGSGPRPELFTEGTVVIDMMRSGSLVWRGTSRDEERSGPGLARRIPENVRKLLSEYPPKHRGSNAVAPTR